MIPRRDIWAALDVAEDRVAALEEGIERVTSQWSQHALGCAIHYRKAACDCWQADLRALLSERDLEKGGTPE